MTDEERHKQLAELRERLQDIPPKVQLQRIMWALTHCWNCGAAVPLEVPVCETCGEELTQHGKH